MEHSNIDNMVTPFLNKLFDRSHSQETLVLVMKSGELKKLYWKDFISGAVLEGIVQRAKEIAVERAIKGEPIMIKVDDLIGALETEFTESSILPSDSSRDDWLQLLDVDARKVARVRLPGDTDQSATATMQRSII
jgi:proteasome-associated ATPase